MNARTLKLCQSMRNVIAVFDAHPALRAAAAESKAFELFVAAASDLADLHDDQASSRTELAQLAARKRALVADINPMRTRLHATAASFRPAHRRSPPLRRWPLDSQDRSSP